MATDAVASFQIRRAFIHDHSSVMEIVTEQDLDYTTLELSDFWVAGQDGKVVSVLRLEDFDRYYFLSAVGTLSVHQHRGYASRLIVSVLKNCRKPVYLYTVIPDFFSLFGFSTVIAPPDLPSRTLFDCERCQPDRCACMARFPEL